METERGESYELKIKDKRKYLENKTSSARNSTPGPIFN